MSEDVGLSRLGHAVIKLRAKTGAYFLMNSNRKYNDISFVGRHEEAVDDGKLSVTALRELGEEVAALSESVASLLTGKEPAPQFVRLRLVPLTGELAFGPVYSVSKLRNMRYELQFFLVEFLSSPAPAMPFLEPGTPNVLVPQEVLVERRRGDLSRWVGLLQNTYPGGLEAIPYSWPADLTEYMGAAG